MTEDVQQVREVSLKRLHDLSDALDECAEQRDPDRMQRVHGADAGWRARSTNAMYDAAAILRGVATGRVVVTR